MDGSISRAVRERLATVLLPQTNNIMPFDFKYLSTTDVFCVVLFLNLLDRSVVLALLPPRKGASCTHVRSKFEMEIS